jgi:hypothetical protein
MDGFLDVYHDTFGFPDYGRSERPLNAFLYEVRRDNELIIKGRSQISIGDIRLTLKKPLISSEGFIWSVEGDIELPTGNAKKGFGNGSLDFGISTLIDKALSQIVMTYWNAGVVFPGDVRGYQKIGLKDFIYGGVTIEALVSEKLAFLAQLYGQSSIYPETDLLAVDRAAYLLSFGGRYYSGKGSLEISLTEDINTSGAPDFILNLTYKLLL